MRFCCLLNTSIDLLIKINIKGLHNQKMKLNRSLKELKIQHHKFQEEISSTYKYNLNFSTTPNTNINLDSISNVLNNYQVSHTPKHIDSSKTHKYTQSQTRLEVPTIKFQVTSPKQHYTQIKTERVNTGQKGNENIDVSPFDISKYIKPYEPTIKVLTPANRNLCVEEPRRPKILNKQKHLSFFEEFKLGKVLGKGKFGNVYRAQHNFSKFVVAAKQISLAKVSPKLIERLVYEIKIQSFLKHEHCLQLYKFYKQGSNLYLVIELGESSLFDRLREKKFFSESESVYYITQTIKALIYLHANNIIHRDLKPENIVLINNVVKLADFGWSIYLGHDNQKRTTFCGTLDYVSPEIVMGSEYDSMVDVWSVGVLCYELCTGHAPFESTKSRQETYRKILNVDLKFPKYLSAQVKDFISKLLTKKPEDRMSLEQALNHPWIRKYTNK